ncbi:MAG: sugar phosphate nucleotidyltransferase [Ferruginibacter sp.]
MIFSAGLGTRFKPWTDAHPKALAVVNGKTLLQRNIEYLQRYHITDVVINVHHFADQIVEILAKNNNWGSNIFISDETEMLLDTGGGLLAAKDLLQDNEPFISLNVDILTNLNLSKLIAYHKQLNALVAFGITNRKTSRYFLFDETNRLCGWRNTITGHEILTLPARALHEMAYSCVCVYDQKIFSLITQNGKFSITEPFLQLAPQHLIMGYDHTGDIFVDVGRTESIAAAEKIFI